MSNPYRYFKVRICLTKSL